jgi:hypothetical protein
METKADAEEAEEAVEEDGEGDGGFDKGGGDVNPKGEEDENPID